MIPLEPVDQLHADCLYVYDQLRRQFELVRRRVASWEPAPCPDRGGEPEQEP
jgi:hypothetical protein